MGAHGSDGAGGGEPVFEDGGIPGPSAYSATGEISAGRQSLRHIERQSIQLPAASGIEIRQHGFRQFMPEGDAAADFFDHSNPHAVCQALDLAAEHTFQHTVFYPAADHRGRLQDIPAGRSQLRRPRQHGIAHRLWNPLPRA
jgi:hypothetical protein